MKNILLVVLLIAMASSVSSYALLTIRDHHNPYSGDHFDLEKNLESDDSVRILNGLSHQVHGAMGPRRGLWRGLF